MDKLMDKFTITIPTTGEVINVPNENIQEMLANGWIEWNEDNSILNITEKGRRMVCQ